MTGSCLLNLGVAQRRADALARAEARARVKQYTPLMRRQLREFKDWTLQDMADIVGVGSRQAVGHWESENPAHARMPRPEYAEKYGHVLDLIATELAGRTEAAP